MENKQHHDLLLNSKIHTINILNLCIINLRNKTNNNYICNILDELLNKEPFNLMLSSLQENYTTINKFIDIWYYKIYNVRPTKTLYGIFGISIKKENTEKRIEFLEQIIKQLNKPSKNKKT